MNKPLFITTWILAFLIQQMVLLGGSTTRCCYRYSNREFMVFPTDPGYLVFTEVEYDQLGMTFDEISDAGGYWVRVFPERSTGPIPGILEWYQTTSYMPDPSSLRITSFDWIDITQHEQVLIHKALVDHAWKIPELADDLPGEPAISTFESGLLSESLASIFLQCIIPTFIACGVSRINWSEMRTALGFSPREGHCVYCGYDCHDLPSPICPECGHNHAQPLSA